MKQQQFNLLPIVAFGGLLSVIAAPSEPSECMGKKRKKGTVVEEFYEVDSIKARRVVKGGGLEYLVKWLNPTDVRSEGSNPSPYGAMYLL